MDAAFGRLRVDRTEKVALMQATCLLNLTLFTEESVRDFKEIVSRKDPNSRWAGLVVRSELREDVGAVILTFMFVISLVSAFFIGRKFGFRSPDGLLTIVCLAVFLLSTAAIYYWPDELMRAKEWRRMPVGCCPPQSPLSAHADAVQDLLPGAKVFIDEHLGRRRIYSLLVLLHEGQEFYVAEWDRPRLIT